MVLSNKRRQLFEEVTQAIGVFGHEVEIRRVLERYYRPLADELMEDQLGSLIAHKKSNNPNAPKVLVLAHMDEVGFRVGSIESDGTLKMHKLPSGIWEQTLMSQRVYVQTKTGKVLEGVIDTIPPHQLTPELRAKPMKAEDMLVDLGCSTKEEAIALGVSVNDSIVIRGDFQVLNGGKRLISKAFDNRYGCILGIELLQALQSTNLDIDLYIGASVQEEAGVRGAQTVAQMIQPDFAIVLDCSPASDMGGNKKEYGQLGGGVLIRFVDASMIAFPELLNYQIGICKKVGVPYQYYLSYGGTDAGIVHKSLGGIPTLTQCICARNIHTSGSIIDLDDYEGARKVTLKMLKTLSSQTIERFKNANR